jgi:hypothetical protein
MTDHQTINQITARLHLLDKRGTTDALEIGALLIDAKERLAAEENQSFSNWIQAEFAWSHRTADRFMRARKWHDNQPVKTRHCVESGLTVTALYVISADDVPPMAQKAILKLAQNRRVGGTAAREVIAKVRATEECSDPPEAAEAEETPGSELAKAIETILACDPHAQNLNGLESPALIGAAEILCLLARRLRGNDAVQLAADRAEARSAATCAKMGHFEILQVRS